MGNYTTLELEVIIKPEFRNEVKHVDDWLKEALIYNPDITPDWSYNKDTRLYKLDDGREISLPRYDYDSHPFFSNQSARDLIGLHKSGKFKDQVWYYDTTSGRLIVENYFKDYDNQLEEFLNWLSPKVEMVIAGEYNTEDDLEGPRWITLVDGLLVIDQYSFTR